MTAEPSPRQFVLARRPKARCDHRPEAHIIERYCVRDGMTALGYGAHPKLAWIRARDWLKRSER